MTSGVDIIFYIAVLIMSVVIHEVSHGYAALYWGDQTARLAGRLTLNPLKHLDPVGSVLIPLILVITKAGIIFGWARPVPYNPNNLRNQKWGTLSVAAAGILANLLVAVVFSVLLRAAYAFDLASPAFYSIATIIVLLNIVLAVFNLVPIPPLDGSKILFSLLPLRSRNIQYFLERYSLFILLFFIFFLWKYLSAVIFYLFGLFTGTQFTGIGF